jgi:hypothetical protein
MPECSGMSGCYVERHSWWIAFMTSLKFGSKLELELEGETPWCEYRPEYAKWFVCIPL